MTKTTSKRSPKSPDKLAIAAKPAGVHLTQDQLGQVIGGIVRNKKGDG